MKVLGNSRVITRIKASRMTSNDETTRARYSRLRGVNNWDKVLTVAAYQKRRPMKGTLAIAEDQSQWKDGMLKIERI